MDAEICIEFMFLMCRVRKKNGFAGADKKKETDKEVSHLFSVFYSMHVNAGKI